MRPSNTTDSRKEQIRSWDVQSFRFAMHGYQVRSNLPLIGRLVAWLRKQSTSHVKEAYLDRIILRQIEYNRTLANEIGRLQNEVADLRQQLQKR